MIPGEVDELHISNGHLKACWCDCTKCRKELQNAAGLNYFKY